MEKTDRPKYTKDFFVNLQSNNKEIKTQHSVCLTMNILVCLTKTVTWSDDIVCSKKEKYLQVCACEYCSDALMLLSLPINFTMYIYNSIWK